MMSMLFRVEMGSGKATCKVCEKIIEKNQVQVRGMGFQSTGNVHLMCLTVAGVKAIDKHTKKLLKGGK